MHGLYLCNRCRQIWNVLELKASQINTRKKGKIRAASNLDFLVLFVIRLGACLEAGSLFDVT